MKVYHTSDVELINRIYKACKEYRDENNKHPNRIILTKQEYDLLDKRCFEGSRKHTIEEMKKGYVVKLDDMTVIIEQED